jgi:hypothetical protein
MNERIKLPVSIRLDDLPKDIGELLRAGNNDLPVELHLVTGTATVEFFAIMDPPKRPNEKTLEAMREADRREFVGSFDSAKEMLAQLDGAADD